MTKEALKLALEALEYRGVGSWRKKQPSITAIKEALAQTEHCSDCGQKLGDANHIHTCSPQTKQKPMHSQLKKMLEDYFDKCFAESSPQRTWVGLTDKEIYEIGFDINVGGLQTMKAYKAIEAALRSKNT